MTKKSCLLILFLTLPILSFSQDIYTWLTKQIPKEEAHGFADLKGKYKEIFVNLTESEMDSLIDASANPLYEEVLQTLVKAFKEEFNQKELEEIAKSEQVGDLEKYDERLNDVIIKANSDLADAFKKANKQVVSKLRKLDFAKEDFTSDSCSYFKEGEFLVLNQQAEIKIKRKGNVQVEAFQGTETKSQVTWTGKCSYNLRITDTNLKDGAPTIGSVVEVKIIGIKEKSYWIRAYSQYYDEEFILELKKIK
ncbi:MAG: hypothetical protein ACK4ND_12415 [Cytophagaceae bacterium]